MGHMGSALWIITTSMYSSCRRASDAFTDSIMCFLERPLSSDLEQKTNSLTTPARSHRYAARTTSASRGNNNYTISFKLDASSKLLQSK